MLPRTRCWQTDRYRRGLIVELQAPRRNPTEWQTSVSRLNPSKKCPAGDYSYA